MKHSLSDCDLRTAIHLLYSNIYLGPDGIHPKIIKNLISFVLAPFKMDLQFIPTMVPQFWKNREVISIYKNSIKHYSPTSCHPVFLTSYISKILKNNNSHEKSSSS